MKLPFFLFQLYFYIVAFQAVDEEEFGGIWELTKEGFMTRLTHFQILFFTLVGKLVSTGRIDFTCLVVAYL